MEKIRFIHRSVGVYYHYYPFFLSKLTKEGKVPKRGQNVLMARPTRRERTSVYKKSEAHLRGKHKGNDDANARPSELQTSVRVQTQALLDFSLVYRKNKTQMTHPMRRTYSARTENPEPGQLSEHQNHRKTGSAVENVLHIHSRECAEEPIFW
ncbi:hypothetical protein NX784_15425 [Massilia pinisoli]|uniref:Uncharacterized protein n=1 Tax=Massilia pinisoli TaxID=1772194 RepID=A0ABT1ZTJ8_9BURK|nr:hypothetical protein [Massilia pinisoli]MCS0582979.1 hypothetical protein [Massilia pinisoli]